MTSLLAMVALTEALNPTGASVARSGYWTITKATPAPFAPQLRQPPPQPTPAQQAANERFARYATWQGRAIGEAATVHNFLLEREKGNYVDMRYEGSESGVFRVVYSFLRDGPGTLRKYSRNPDHVGETVRWSKAEQQAALQSMLDFLRQEQVGWTGHTGGASNRAEVRLSLTEAEWKALVARTGFKTPEPVLLTFAERSAREINGPLPAAIASGIRFFARSDAPSGPVPSVARQNRIVLRDGCFRLAGRPEDGAHVLFPLGQQLFVDSAGYLAFGSGPHPGYARVGEVVEVDGTFAPVERPTKLTTPLLKACGPGRVVAITAPRSGAAADAQTQLDDRQSTYLSLRQMWGLTDKGARAFLVGCAKRGPVECILPPPPPAFGPCPPGSTKSGGVCLTPEGHIRPLPSHLEPYAKL